MSSVLVFSRPSNNKLGAIQRYGQPERGDVIDVRPEDDFHWGDAVMGPARLGWWQVIVVPNAGIDRLYPLTQGSPLDTEGWTAWRHRVWSLNLDALAQPGEIWTVPLDWLLANATAKPESQRLLGALLPGPVFG